MPIQSFRISDGSREEIKQYIKQQKLLGKFTVLDVGASMNTWSIDCVDAIIDMNVMNASSSESKIRFFFGDINQSKVWKDINDWVQKNGLFDFCICTHTLEDIRDPYYVCEEMSKIAKSGYIAIPSKYRELSRFEYGQSGYRGYIHHRWIFTIENGHFVGYPKLSIIDYLEEMDSIASMAPEKYDLSFIWKDNIPIKLYNDDYMGPTTTAVISYFKRLLNEY